MVPMFLWALGAMSQNVIKGRIIDSQTKEELIGATVMLEGTTQGAATNLDGSFVLKTSESGKHVLVFRCVGYKELKKDVNITANVNLGDITLETESIGLGDVTVTASVAVRRKTPVAVSVIEPAEIENKLSTQEFPEILKSTPSIYATKQGGAYGDSRVNLRGFEQPNIAIMVNGVPMNDMEWGGVYWSNWQGLTDVTRSMQVQRGLGAAKTAAPSVGGSINVVTYTTDAKAGGSVAYSVGNDGYNKISFNASTGMVKGWAFSLMGAKTWGDGYIKGTEFEGYTYFGNISKQFGTNHMLSLTAFGAPQWHNQRNRNDKLKIEEWQKQDGKYKYNPTYGFGLGGERKTSAYNKFHKPQISLNHFWTINEKSSLSSIFYVSIGRGGGYSGQGYSSDYRNQWYGTNKSTGLVNTTLRRADGTFDYGAIYGMNAGSLNGSLMAMSNSINNHNWYGLMSTYTTKLGKYFDVYGGIDLRYYKGKHTNELIDLYGGEFFDDYSSRSSVEYRKGDLEWQHEKLGVGDVVYRDYDGFVMQEGAFGQGEFTKNALSVTLAASVSNTTYWRYDRFYYAKSDRKSDKVSFVGFTVKGGANYNLNEKHNVFGNIGYISRAPFFSGGAFLQSTTSNETNKNAVNEKVFSAEVGYGFRSQMFSANLNLYRTAWMDKTMTKSFTDDRSGDRGSINMSGVDALHMGIEVDFAFRPFEKLDITGMVSIGDWKWNSNATGYAYNSLGQAINSKWEQVPINSPEHARMKINLKDVRVGNSAQTTFAIGGRYEFMKGLRLGVDYTYFARNYSEFEFEAKDFKLQGEKTYTTPWKIPSAGVMDMNMSYRFPLGKLWGTISANVNNVLDQVYITDALDNSSTHDWRDVSVFYGFGRTYSVRLRIGF